MALSNAERQKRFRQRLKAKADGVNLPEQIKAALDAATRAAWCIWKRQNYSGLGDYPNWEAMRAAFASDPAAMRALFDLQDQANEQESLALALGTAIVDVFPDPLKRRLK